MGLVLDSIRAMLSDRGTAFREVHHEPTTTSEESARARGEPLRIGMPVRADDRQVGNRTVKLPRKLPCRWIGWKEPVGVKRHDAPFLA